MGDRMWWVEVSGRYRRGSTPVRTLGMGLRAEEELSRASLAHAHTVGAIVSGRSWHVSSVALCPCYEQHLHALRTACSVCSGHAPNFDSDLINSRCLYLIVNGSRVMCCLVTRFNNSVCERSLNICQLHFCPFVNGNIFSAWTLAVVCCAVTDCVWFEVRWIGKRDTEGYLM